MKERLLNYLVCPVCTGKLSLKIFEKTEEILSGLLTCQNKHWYPIINEIPRMLDDSLKKELLYSQHKNFFNKYKNKLPRIKDKKEAFTKNKSNTAKIFGYEWTNFSELYNIYEKQFKEWTYPLEKKDFKNKFILDAGCGTGRHIYYAQKYGAKEIIGMDLSEAVEVANKNNKKENIHIIQGDIYHPPFKKKIFDLIYSIGVLHHLPNPKKGFESLLRFGKKEGSILVWVYGKPSFMLKYILDPLRRNFISKMPTPIIKVFAFLITLIVFPVSKLIFGPLNKLTKLATHIPMNYTFNYISKFNFRIVFSMMYDISSPPNQYYLTEKAMKDWFYRPKIRNPKIFPLKHSWRANGIIK